MTRTIRNLVMAFVVTIGAAGALASPALAAEWDHGRDGRAQEWRGQDDHGRDGRAQEWRGRDWRDYDRDAYRPAPYAYAAPAYGYYGYVAPPPVTYAPPAATFSLFVPFTIR
jgi:hypothetical protein